MISTNDTSPQQQSATIENAQTVASRLLHSPGCVKDGGYNGIPCSCGLDDELLQLGFCSD